MKIYNISYRIYDIRSLYYAFLFNSCGTNLKFFGPCWIKNPQGISVGNNVTINDGVYLNGLGGIDIGNNVSISACAIVVSTGLDTRSLGACKKHINEIISIGNNVQVGAGAVLLAGVTIGNDVIIGAGSVVTKDVPSDSVVCGVPARRLRDVLVSENDQ
ncbi:acyltransferase [Marinobacter sp.]|uniref:acyltransferase n=1 Tax=Marinobacter sp. TaxID=50741 RepID=UPI00198D1F1B|nr:acyltransferase [Marinobacter sp.]MBC7192783.1 acyltransferase [Marinobacter sp.]